MDTMDAPKSKRRWFSYRLQILLALMLLAGIGVSWFAMTIQRAKMQREAVEAIVKLTPTITPAAVCFGIPCEFSGKLSDEQEKNVPSVLHGAFYIESVRNVTSTELAKELEHKEKLAEETHNGSQYVALKDYRCVDFGGQSGMMIAVERYKVTNK